MTIKYQPHEFEQKWAKDWEKNKTYKTPDLNKKPSLKGKQFIFPMFPYPSGAGLHVGHVRVYTGTDVIARFYRMNQYAVLHPIGWDAFGLPAENAAIKAKKNPMDMVPDHIATFKRQMKSLGFSFDWDREFATTDPSYYKWTQWLFLQFYKMGLLYKKNAPINFCPSCKTGLAEEEVLANGTHERCGTKIVKKDLPQWLFKITSYADRLLEDLKGLDWPKGILEMQKNWIGKKEGVIIHHKIEGMNLSLDTFSAFPAWLFADTFIVIAPEHPLVQKLIKEVENENKINDFIEEHRKMTKEEITAGNFEKKGIFTGKYALDPFNKNRKMPIWLANFALMDFGTGIIRCSAHDIRDYEFAQKYNIELAEVVERENPDVPINAHENKGILKDSGPFSGKEISVELIKKMLDWIEENKIGKRETTYHLHDWIFSRQRYWGEPIPIIDCKKCGLVPVSEDQLPVELPKVKSYEPTETGESPLTAIKDWVNVKCPKCGQPAKRETDTMPNWAGSCWYFIAFAFWNQEKENPKIQAPNSKRNSNLFGIWNLEFGPLMEKWLPTDWYIGGAEHAVLHLLYARFWVKALYDLKLLNFKEPFTRLRNLGMILAEDHRKMSKSLGNVVNPDDVQKEYGADALRIYEMFIAPFDQEIAWSTNALQGAYRFMIRVWKLFHDPKSIGENEDKQLVSKLQKTIVKITKDIPDVKFNTSVAAMMGFINEWCSFAEASEGQGKLSRENAKKFLQVLAPFAPFTAEEIWHEVFGEKDSIHLSIWPKVDSKEIIEDVIQIPVQVNGKVRAVIQLTSSDSSEDNIVQQALNDERVKKYVEGKKYKTIYVKGKILNLVIQ